MISTIHLMSKSHFRNVRRGIASPEPTDTSNNLGTHLIRQLRSLRSEVPQVVSTHAGLGGAKGATHFWPPRQIWKPTPVGTLFKFVSLQTICLSTLKTVGIKERNCLKTARCKRKHIPYISILYLFFQARQCRQTTSEIARGCARPHPRLSPENHRPTVCPVQHKNPCVTHNTKQGSTR